MLSPNSKRILKFLQDNSDTYYTSDDVAEALGLTKKVVDCTFTQLANRKQLGERVPGEIELDNGLHKAVKFLVLNEEGLNFDPASEENPVK